MKTNYLPHQTKIMLSGIFLCLAFFAFSQEAIDVQITAAHMSEGQQTGYHVEIPKADLKTTQLNWVKKLQENIKVKVKEVNHEWVLTNAVKIELTKDTLSVYTIFIQKDDKIHMNVFIKIDSVFFSPDDDESKLASHKTDHNIKNYIRNFAVAQYKMAVGLELESGNKLLKTLENDLKKIEKENENLTKEISSLENDIEKTNRDISSIDQQLDMKNQEIITHTSSVIDILGEEEKKAAREKEKSLEKEKNKLDKERSNANKNISNMESKIKNNEKTIEDNEKLLEEKQAEIDAQKKAVAEIQAVLNSIK